MDYLKQILKENLNDNDACVIEIEGLGKKTLAEWKNEFSKALHDEFKNDPEYQRRISQ